MTPAFRPPSPSSVTKRIKVLHLCPTPSLGPCSRDTGQCRPFGSQVSPRGPAVLGCLGLPGPESASGSEAGMRQSCGSGHKGFLGGCAAYGILVPDRNRTCVPSAVKAWSFDHWTPPPPREVPRLPFSDAASDNGRQASSLQIPQEGLAHVASTVTLKQNERPCATGDASVCHPPFSPKRSFKTRASAGGQPAERHHPPGESRVHDLPRLVSPSHSCCPHRWV